MKYSKKEFGNLSLKLIKLNQITYKLVQLAIRKISNKMVITTVQEEIYKNKAAIQKENIKMIENCFQN